jgi:hypothetical protein
MLFGRYERRRSRFHVGLFALLIAVAILLVLVLFAR